MKWKGLYIKLVTDEYIIGHFKWVRRNLVQAIQEAGQCHSAKPFVPNFLAKGADLYAPKQTLNWSDFIARRKV